MVSHDHHHPVVGAGLFAVAPMHTFSPKFFERMAHCQPDHAGIWHLFGEVEIVFAFWAMVMVEAMALLSAVRPPPPMSTRATTPSRCSCLPSW